MHSLCFHAQMMVKKAYRQVCDIPLPYSIQICRRRCVSKPTTMHICVDKGPVARPRAHEGTVFRVERQPRLGNESDWTWQPHGGRYGALTCHIQSMLCCFKHALFLSCVFLLFFAAEGCCTPQTGRAALWRSAAAIQRALRST